MIIIMYSLVTPYERVGYIHNDLLDGIGSILLSAPMIPVLDYAPALSSEVAITHFSPALSYSDEMGTEALYYYALLGHLSALSATETPDLSHGYLDVDTGNMFDKVLQDIFTFMDGFCSAHGVADMPSSVIFLDDPFNPADIPAAGNPLGLTFKALFDEEVDKLFVQIASGFRGSLIEKILPQVAITALRYSYKYWKAVFENVNWQDNTIAGNVWHDYLTNPIPTGLGLTSLKDDIDWMMIIRLDIKGAVVGAVAGKGNGKENHIGNTVYAAALAGATASTIGVAIGKITPVEVLDTVVSTGNPVSKGNPASKSGIKGKQVLAKLKQPMLPATNKASISLPEKLDVLNKIKALAKKGPIKKILPKKVVKKK